MSDIIVGQDLSRHNDNDEIMDNSAFIFLKASEGMTYTDPTVDIKLKAIAEKRKDNLPIIGFYHYARPNNNSPEEETDNFLKRIEPHIGQCLMALDWEGTSTSLHKVVQGEWINKFCGIIYNRTGVAPLLYISESPYRSIKDYLNPQIPTWIAKYGNRPINYNTQFPLMWQFTNTPFDIDLFYGSPAQLAAMAIPK